MLFSFKLVFVFVCFVVDDVVELYIAHSFINQLITWDVVHDFVPTDSLAHTSSV